MPRRTPLLLAAALVAASLTAPGNALAASALALTPPAGPVEEGEAAEITIAFDTTAGAPTEFAISWGDGTLTRLAASPPTATAGHAYADEGIYPVRVRAALAGGEVSRGTEIIVVNAAPVLGFLPDASAPLGEAFELVVSFSDRSAPGLHDLTVDWGDGTAPDLLPGLAGTTASLGARTPPASWPRS
ncbi:MAG: hypothetical protein MUE66_08135 [Acidimicrobiia bacterium]|nr:hypothetical protein [Acidimicrobiia bacterium]